jgi:hypothetical protein
MAGRSAADYETLLQDLKEAPQGQQRAEEQQRQVEEEREHEAELRKQAEEQERQAEELTRGTNFDAYIAACHSPLCAPLRVACPSRSTHSLCRRIDRVRHDGCRPGHARSCRYFHRILDCGDTSNPPRAQPTLIQNFHYRQEL